MTISRPRVAFGVALTGFGAAVLAFGAEGEKLTRLHLPTALFTTCLYVGALGVLLGVVVVFTALDMPRPDIRYDFRKMRRDEMRTLLRFSRRFLGQVLTLRAAKDVYRANPNATWVAEKVSIYKSGEVVTKLVGFFTILPLKAKALDLLDAENLDGLRLTSEHIAGPKERAAALYIGSIAAKGFRAKAEILGYVRGRVEEEVDGGIPIAYTRPVTKDGLRLAKRHGFQPVADDCGDEELQRIYKKVFTT